MLGIGCLERHALPRITPKKMYRPGRVLPPARAGSFIGASRPFRLGFPMPVAVKPRTRLLYPGSPVAYGLPRRGRA